MSDLTVLRIYFRDEDIPELRLQMEGDDGFWSLDHERELDLPNGEKIEVYAEVGIKEDFADISVSVTQNGKNFDVRCGFGVIVSYETEKNFEVLLQVGSGGWE